MTEQQSEFRPDTDYPKKFRGFPRAS